MIKFFVGIVASVLIPLGVNTAQAATLPAGSDSLENHGAAMNVQDELAQGSFETAAAQLPAGGAMAAGGLELSPPAGPQNFTWFDWDVHSNNGLPLDCFSNAPRVLVTVPGPIPSVPLPAGGLLLLTALGGLGFARRRKAS